MIKLYNSLSKKIESFVPINTNKITMYVCGPTVYSRPHLGNARSIVVYDILYRVLLQKYGNDKVVYVRNITDVDDKINAAAKKNNISIQSLTHKIIDQFNEDTKVLNCLKPSIEPKATEHISEMISMIEGLISNGSAYVADGHVYFDVSSFKHYYDLSGRDLSEMIAGSRIDVIESKHNPADFVLWKPKDDEDDESSVFESPWGAGRPGWHIECSAMSTQYLGKDFDIHGGGVDLIFPHHTNEIAQSCAYHKNSSYAKYWVHNGFLLVNGEKMSKSLGNFFTVHDMVEKGIRGETLRLAYLTTHYRKPLNFTDKITEDSKKALDSFYRIFTECTPIENAEISDDVLASLYNDLNVPEVISTMHELANLYHKSTQQNQKQYIANKLYSTGKLLGLFFNNPHDWFKDDKLDAKVIDELVEARAQAKRDKDWARADEIRRKLSDMNIILEDNPNGTTLWRAK